MNYWLAIWILAGAPLQGDRAPPAVTVAPAAIDFGDVSPDTTLARTVIVRNDGARPIELGRCSADCVCLTGSTTQRHMPPSGRVEWTVTLSTCEYQGEVRRQVWLEPVAAGGPRLAVPVRYRVLPGVYAEPSHLALGVASTDLADELEAEIELRSLERQPVELLGARSGDPSVDVRLGAHSLRADAPVTVRVRVQRPLVDSTLSTSIEIGTTSADVPVIRIPVFAEFMEGLSEDIRALDFGNVALGTSSALAARWRSAAPLALREVRGSNETVDVRLEQSRPDDAAIHVSVQPGLALGTFRGNLLLYSEGASPRRLKLPYRGRVVVDDAPPNPPAARSGAK